MSIWHFKLIGLIGPRAVSERVNTDRQHFGLITVCELMGRVRNVVLIECTLGPGKPKRGRDFGREGTLAW